MKARAPLSFLRVPMAALFILALASCGGGDVSGGISFNTPQPIQAASTELIDAYAATLTGDAETPPTFSQAQGAANLVIDPATREVLATVTSSAAADTAVVIREAPPGEEGPVVLSLAETTPVSGVWTARAVLTPEQFAALRAGNYYVEVLSAAFPGGELRGQIAPQRDAGADGIVDAVQPINGVPLTTLESEPLVIRQGEPSASTFIASLKGDQQVPPVPSAARGAATLTVDPGTGLLIAAVNTLDLQATAAQIRQGAAGVNGPLVIPLTAVAPGSAIWTVRTTLTDAQYDALRLGNLYFNVLTRDFPAGEIRGQILPQKNFVTTPLLPSGVPAAGTATPMAPGIGTLNTDPLAPSGMDIGTGIGIGIGIGFDGIGSSPVSTDTLSPPGINPALPPFGITAPVDTGIGTGSGAIDIGIGTDSIGTSSPVSPIPSASLDVPTQFETPATGIPATGTGTASLAPGF